MAYILVFGLPATGKTTFVKSTAYRPLTLDLGNISSDAKTTVNPRMIDFTSNLLAIPTQEVITIDSYPDYFDPKRIPDEAIKRVIFAIPSKTYFDQILTRVRLRDGLGSDFVRLYTDKLSQ